MLSCNQKSKKDIIIESFIVGKNFHYNPSGFLNTPYGRVYILKKSIFINGKLDTLLWNRANGFLDYSFEDLRRDTILYKSFEIDSLFLKNKRLMNRSEKIKRNDSLFLKQENNVLIVVEE